MPDFLLATHEPLDVANVTYPRNFIEFDIFVWKVRWTVLARQVCDDTRLIGFDKFARRYETETNRPRILVIELQEQRRFLSFCNQATHEKDHAHNISGQ